MQLLNRWIKCFLATFFTGCFFFYGLACADTVYLDDGSIVQGTIQVSDNDIVKIKTINGVEEINRKFIKRIITNETQPAVTSPIEQQPVSEINVSQTEQKPTVENNESIFNEIENQPSDNNVATHKNNNNISLVKNKTQYSIKLSPNFAGNHELSDGYIYLSGYGELDNLSGSTDVNTGFTISGELLNYIEKNFGLGAGIAFQLPRKQSDSEGKFSFIPVYGLAKLRTSPSKRGNYQYAIGQLGYNFFSGDSDYKGQGGKLTGGIYWGLGAGLAFDIFNIELLYAVNHGKFKQSTYVYDYDYSVYRYLETSGKVAYSTVSINFGVSFH